MPPNEKRLVPKGMPKEDPAPPQEVTKKEGRPESMSIGGFFENLSEDAKEIASGVVDSMAITGKSISEIIKHSKHIPELMKHPEWLGQELWNTTKGLGKAIAQPYQEHGLRVGYEKPLTVAGDLMTVLSAGGGLAAKAGKLSKISKLERLGNVMKAIPEGIGKVVTEAPLKAIGINPASRKALITLEREEKTIGELTKKKLNEVLDAKFKGLTDQDKALLDKLAVEGGTLAELQANPRVAEALKAYQGIVKEIREMQLGEKGRRLLTTEQMEEAVLKKFANRRGVSPEDAKALYDQLEVKPGYTPAIAKEGKQVGIMDLIWGPDEIRTGGVGFLEKFKGGQFSQDPVAYMKKAVSDFVDTETRLKFMDRVIQDPKLIRPITKGESALGQVVPEGIFKKYFEDRSRAQAAAVRDVKLKHGIEEAERLLTSDPVTQKYVQSIASIGATDKTVANYLRFTFTRASGRLGAFLRVYDKVLSAFKMSATTLNPRFYTGNIVGDGILSVMAGEYGLHWKTAKRLVDSLPPELRVGGRALLTENPIMAKFQKWTEIAQAADDLARAGIWTKEVASKFKNAGASFAAVDQTFDDFFRAVGGSVEDLSNMEMKVQLASEKIASNVPKLRGMNEGIERLQNKAIQEANAAYRARQSGKDPSKAEARYRVVNDQLIDLTAARDKVFGEVTAQMKASGEWERMLPETRKYAEVARYATDRANTFLGDYFALGPIERAVFRRVVPFYSFTKAMTKLAFTYPFIAPKTAFFWHRYSQSLADMVGDPEIPEYMAGYFPVGGEKDGDTYWMRLSQLGPFGGVRSGRFGDAPVPSIVQFWQQNPIIRLGYRMVGGRDEFYWAGKPEAGKVWVSAGDGRIHRFRPDGTIETVVPQMPLLEGVSTMFPSVQMVQQLISDYDVAKGNERKPDGSLKHPVSTLQNVAKTLGFNLKTGTKEEFQRGVKARAMMVFKDLERQYPKMDPEQREYTRELFKDFSGGQYRKFKVPQ